MQLFLYLKTKLPILTVLGLFIGVTSCGSYQYAGQDNDGIYDSETVKRSKENQPQTKTANSDYYKNYFNEKEGQYAGLTDDNAIFTDIDNYESDYLVDESVESSESYAGWGQENDNVTINVYGGHLFNSNRWNRPYFGFSYGWGYSGYYNSFWCPPYYGYASYWSPWHYGYGYNYYRPYGYGYSNYGSHHNGYRRGVAYNSGRRSSIYNNSSRRNSNSYSRRSITRRSSSNISRNGVQRGKPSNSTRPRVRPYSSSRPNVNNTRPSTRPRVRPNNSSSRPKVNRPSSNRVNRSSRPSTRVNRSSRSSSSRSSSSSSRSSRRRN
jgi:hypothetical protein